MIPKSYEAYVGNIGRIGNYPSRTAANKAIRETIAKSGRADNYGWVCDSEGNLVSEIGRPPRET